MLPNILYVLSLTVLPIFRVVSGLGGSVYANNQLSLQLGDETTERRTSQTHILQRNWGAYSPYYPVAEYVPPPEGCEITQVNILQRHGARYPTAGPAAAIALAVTKLQNVSTFKEPSLEFIRNFTWNLGTSDLVLFGAAQSLAAGAETYHRYNGLVSSDNIPFVRASGSERVIMSATNWTYGFSAASGMRFNPVLSVILNESANNTLHNSCPSIGSSNTQTDIWIGIYTKPIVQRLNDAAPGAKLTGNDVYYLMALCAFESVAINVISDWCGLFDEDEWKGFEYEMDLDKYYGTGYGQLLGPVEGVGYINELIARLTSRPVNDTTQTNTTLDQSLTTFPLNRTIYADFSHDDQLVAIYSAMGLFKQPMALDPTSPLDLELLGNGLDKENPKRTWIASHLVPFSARMVVEKMQCRQLSSEDYMRILVNDAVQPLDFCSGVTPEGVCRVSAFVESQGYATSGGNGDWQKCFE